MRTDRPQKTCELFSLYLRCISLKTYYIKFSSQDTPSARDVLLANKYNKKTRKREKNLKKVKKIVEVKNRIRVLQPLFRISFPLPSASFFQKTKKKKKNYTNNFHAIHLIHDPQGIVIFTIYQHKSLEQESLIFFQNYRICRKIIQPTRKKTRQNRSKNVNPWSCIETDRSSSIIRFQFLSLHTTIFTTSSFR